MSLRLSLPPAAPRPLAIIDHGARYLQEPSAWHGLEQIGNTLEVEAEAEGSRAGKVTYSDKIHILCYSSLQQTQLDPTHSPRTDLVALLWAAFSMLIP